MKNATNNNIKSLMTLSTTTDTPTQFLEQLTKHEEKDEQKNENKNQFVATKNSVFESFPKYLIFWHPFLYTLFLAITLLLKAKKENHNFWLFFITYNLISTYTIKHSRLDLQNQLQFTSIYVKYKNITQKDTQTINKTKIRTRKTQNLQQFPVITEEFIYCSLPTHIFEI